jgi:nucleoid DNA-binding protein
MASKKKSITKAQVVADLTKASGLKKVQVAAIVDGIFGVKGIVVKALKEGRPVVIGGFGKFYLHHKKASKARMGRNPATGEAMKIKAKPASWVPKFRYLKATKDAI